jgi:hypothetical protein
VHGAVWIWEMTLFIHRLHLELGNRICGLPGRLIPRLHLKSQLPRSILDEAIRRLELPDSRSEGREGSLKLRITPLQSSLRPFEFLQAGAQLSFCSSRNNPASISAHFTNLESWKIITRQVQWSKFVPSFLGPPSPPSSPSLSSLPFLSRNRPSLLASSSQRAPSCAFSTPRSATLFFSDVRSFSCSSSFPAQWLRAQDLGSSA